MADRLAQVSGHITNTYGRGLLAGEVAIITGKYTKPVVTQVLLPPVVGAAETCITPPVTVEPLDATNWLLTGAGQVSEFLFCRAFFSTLKQCSGYWS